MTLLGLFEFPENCDSITTVRSTQPGHPSLGRGIEYQPKGAVTFCTAAEE